nr:MAG TPA: hypothetical protein [Caudoviricetes sp.]
MNILRNASTVLSPISNSIIISLFSSCIQQHLPYA